MTEVPTDSIQAWEWAVATLKKAERRMWEGLTPDERAELLAALNDADDAWEEHISSVRAWVRGN
jgi:acyl-CoA reductase-like NAD-dependent aldehyde dehydrogenase